LGTLKPEFRFLCRVEQFFFMCDLFFPQHIQGAGQDMQNAVPFTLPLSQITLCRFVLKLKDCRFSSNAESIAATTMKFRNRVDGASNGIYSINLL